MAGVYIHIPFCKRKCSYCDFYSVAAFKDVNSYVENLLLEYDMRSFELQCENVKTLYLGGGTPSILTIDQIKYLFDGLKRRIDFSYIEEVTIEVNPDDVTLKYMKALKKIGVNRVSMGVQSFIDTELQAVNRRHSAAQAFDAVDTIRQAGINNISIDLIYGLPGQTIDSWKYSLCKLLELDVNHISAYNLSYEEGTALTVLRDRGKIVEVDEDTCVDMYNILCESVKNAGYEHYEISNFAKPGEYSKHNTGYWNGAIYLGLGAGAHSYDSKKRRYNIADIRSYNEAILKGELAYEEEIEEWWQLYNEMLLVRLRTMWGIDVAEIDAKFGEKITDRFCSICDGYIKEGLMERVGNIYKLKNEAVMISDSIIRNLMYVED